MTKTLSKEIVATEVVEEENGVSLCVFANGTRRWTNIKGARHREDGPAIEGVSMQDNTPFNIWMQNDLLHRLDGPAVERHDVAEWWVEGKHYLSMNKDGKLISHPFSHDTDMVFDMKVLSKSIAEHRTRILSNANFVCVCCGNVVPATRTHCLTCLERYSK